MPKAKPKSIESNQILKDELFKAIELRISLEVDMIKASVQIEIDRQLKALKQSSFKGLI